jgi:hypothetical protein
MAIEPSERFETKGSHWQKIVPFRDDIRRPNNPGDKAKNSGKSIDINSPGISAECDAYFSKGEHSTSRSF